MGMFGSLFGAPRKKKNPWEDDPAMSAQEQAWGFPAKEDPAPEQQAKQPRWLEGGKMGWKDSLGLAFLSATDNGGGTVGQLMGRAQSARANARKAQADAAAREASAQRMGVARPDLNPAQIEAISYGDFTPDQAMPKQPEAPAFVKNLEAWNQMTPQQQQQVAAMQSVLNPTFGQGADGIRRPDAPVMGTPVGTVEDGYQFMGGDEADERNWKKVGGAGAAGAPPFAGNTLDHITMMSESGGNPNAVSPKGARGLMQVMPDTARDPGFGIRPSNGTQADDVRVGQEYRAAMQRRYQGDPAKMWAAYNAGPGRVDDALKHGEDWLSALPAETRKYVKRNLRQLGM